MPILPKQAILIHRVWVGFLSVALFCMLSGATRAEEASRTLRILNWSDYILLDDSMSEQIPIEVRSPVLRAFAEAHECKIEYSEYQDTYEIDRLTADMHGYFDIVITTHGEALELWAGNFLEAIDYSLVPNSQYLDSYYRIESSKKVMAFSLPYLMGTTGVAYREDLTGGDVKSWQDYFNPPDNLRNKVAILSDERVMFALSLISLGIDQDNASEMEYRKAAHQISELRKNGFIGMMNSDMSLTAEALAKGEIAMAVMYSGDALSASERHSSIRYVVPQEGSEGYMDLICISKASTNKDLAHAFVNYLLDPRVSADNAMYLNFSTPVDAARKLIEQEAPEQLRNPAIYPPQEIEYKLHEISTDATLSSKFWKMIFR